MRSWSQKVGRTERVQPTNQRVQLVALSTRTSSSRDGALCDPRASPRLCHRARLVQHTSPAMMNFAPARRPIGCIKTVFRRARQQRAAQRGLATVAETPTTSKNAITARQRRASLAAMLPSLTLPQQVLPMPRSRSSKYGRRFNLSDRQIPIRCLSFASSKSPN